MALSRRTFLLTAAGAVAAPLLPPLPLSEAIAAATTEEPLLAFAIGHGGEFDWQPFFAASEEAAMREACRYFGEEPDEDGTVSLDCERVTLWDKRRDAGSVTPADWIRAGMGHSCTRCRDETFSEDGGRVIGDEVVCEGCMTFADRLACPEDEWLVAEELADRIYDEGADTVRARLEAEGHWPNIPPALWARALKQAEVSS